ncbi:hypothetical protein [Myxacorys almedinensis]|uniref:Uncharacterized protein n=1 Tax=Myxacorys almedinensis A TaxID=2690445 RepID=A0A8J7Z2C9_9CYAN|nr:hypothetical protein [Myxacorys almedinensis]NDJ16906.1 hypothetical protein [Myxacorys almedinensis A]
MRSHRSCKCLREFELALGKDFRGRSRLEVMRSLSGSKPRSYFSLEINALRSHLAKGLKRDRCLSQYDLQKSAIAEHD